MSKNTDDIKDRVEIIAQLAELSRLLGMIPDDGSIVIREPVTQTSMPLSQWFDTTRSSYLKLSVKLHKSLGIPLL